MQLGFFECVDCGEVGRETKLIYGERCPHCASENVKRKSFDPSKRVADFVCK